MERERFELIGHNIYVNRDHRFGTDALLLARFAAPSGKDTVCDLCSGCGIIPMLFFAWGKPPKKVYAVEIQSGAVELMEESVNENGFTDRMIPVRADLTNDSELLSAVPREKMDIVTVNPPYFKANTGMERLSPAQAAARHELYCDLEQVIRAASLLLRYGGDLKLCHIPERLADVISLMRKYNIEPKVLQFAHNDPKDKPYLLLVSGRKGGKPGLSVREPAVVEDMNRELLKNRPEI